MVPHILVVDTDAGAARVTRAVVARAIPEATVEIAPTFERALLSVQGHPADVLIIDPGPFRADGTRLIEQVKATYPHTRVIVIASMPAPALRRTVQGLGVAAYLEKPAVLTQLRDELDALVGNGAELGPPSNTPSA